MKKGQLVLFIGPTCVGKTSVISSLRERFFPDSGLVVSFTTRAPRTEMGEKNGTGYFFVSEQEFLEKHVAFSDARNSDVLNLCENITAGRRNALLSYAEVQTLQQNLQYV